MFLFFCSSSNKKGRGMFFSHLFFMCKCVKMMIASRLLHYRVHRKNKSYQCHFKKMFCWMKLLKNIEICQSSNIKSSPVIDSMCSSDFILFKQGSECCCYSSKAPKKSWELNKMYLIVLQCSKPPLEVTISPPK